MGPKKMPAPGAPGVVPTQTQGPTEPLPCTSEHQGAAALLDRQLLRERGVA